MGSTFAMELAGSVAKEEISLFVGVMTHLTCNHFPPLPRAMTGTCVRAIMKARNGDTDGFVRMPKGMQYNGRSPRRDLAPVLAVIDAHRLEEFVDLWDEDYYDYEEEECED